MSAPLSRRDDPRCTLCTLTLRGHETATADAEMAAHLRIAEGAPLCDGCHDDGREDLALAALAPCALCGRPGAAATPVPMIVEPGDKGRVTDRLRARRVIARGTCVCTLCRSVLSAIAGFPAFDSDALDAELDLADDALPALPWERGWEPVLDAATRVQFARVVRAGGDALDRAAGGAL